MKTDDAGLINYSNSPDNLSMLIHVSSTFRSPITPVPHYNVHCP